VPIWGQVAIFAITGALLYLGVYYAVPRLVVKGYSPLFAFFACLWIPVLLLLPASLLLFMLVDGGTLTLTEIVARFRLDPIDGMDWLWIVVAIVVTVVSDQALEGLGKYFARKPLLAPPDYLPAPFNPLRPMAIPPRTFFGVSLAGNWKLLALFIPVHALAMFSEEMMWRGYLLPLQEGILGQWAWVLNGILWAWLVHAMLKWHFIGMLPGMLIAPLIAQYTGSTWASFFTHAVPNSLLWILLLLGVLGRGRFHKGEGDGNLQPRDPLQIREKEH